MVLKTDSFSSYQRTKAGHNNVALLEVKLECPAFDHYLDVFLRTCGRNHTSSSKEQLFGLLVLILSQTSDNICLPQKRKVEPAPLAPQVSPVTPVPSLPSSTEASQAAVFPAVRETNTFKSREDHEQLASLTTVKIESSSFFSLFELKSLSPAYVFVFNINITAEWHCPTTRPLTAWEEKES